MTFNEIALALKLANSMLDRLPAGGPIDRSLTFWARYSAVRLSVRPDGKPAGPTAIRKIAARKNSRVRRRIAELCRKHECRPADDETGGNIRALAAAIGMDETETRLFAAQVYLAAQGPLVSLVKLLLQHDFLSYEEICAAITDIDVREARWALYRGLPARGLLSTRNSIRSDVLPVYVPYELVAALGPPNRGLEDIERSLFGSRQTSTLTFDDFDFVGVEADLAVQLLRGADAGGERGVHILLHGAPGTGKSELARLLVAGAGLSAHAVGESDDYGCEPERYERLEELNLLQNLSASRSGLAFVFDEMEDLFTGADRIGGYLKANSKLFLNRLLETNPTPVVWTTNSLESFDRAVVRRMSLVIAMPVQPSQKVRASIWRRCLSASRIAASDDEIAGLGQRYPVAASVASGASRNARMMNGTVTDVVKFADSLSQALQCNVCAETEDGFDPHLITSDTDMSDLIRSIGQIGRHKGFTMLLHGEPGTGKTEFGHALAVRLGRDLMQMRCSDLVSKWVGETEQNIAGMFREAAHHGNVLMIDEIDYLLADRINARHSWEVSQTNEFLTRMDGFRGILVCTTNLVERIDPAAARRFDFKIRLRPLDGPRMTVAFRSFFGRDAPAGLSRLCGLTLGDMAVVKRRLRFAPGNGGDSDRIVAMLADELRFKPARPLAVGFGAGKKKPAGG